MRLGEWKWRSSKTSSWIACASRSHWLEPKFDWGDGWTFSCPLPTTPEQAKLPLDENTPGKGISSREKAQVGLDQITVYALKCRVSARMHILRERQKGTRCCWAKKHHTWPLSDGKREGRGAIVQDYWFSVSISPLEDESFASKRCSSGLYIQYM